MAKKLNNTRRGIGASWKGIALMVVLVLGLLVVTGAGATETPTITTDQADYTPGATVTLTSSGWDANAAVHILVNDNVGASWSYNADVTANGDGAFTHSFKISDTLIAAYTVTATSATASATTTFTDNVVTDFRQCANKDAPFLLGDCHWINSIVQQSNAVYLEGMSNPQRVVFDGVGSTAPGNIHTLTLSHQATKAGITRTTS